VKVLVPIFLLVILLGVFFPAGADESGPQRPESEPVHATPEAHAGEGQHGEESSLPTLFKWANFALVFAALVYVARGRLWPVFAGMRQQIRSEMEAARSQWEESRRRMAEIDERLARLEEEVERMRREAAANSASQLERIREASQREAERIRATAAAEMNSMVRAGRLELRAFTARLAVNLAETRLRQQLGPQAHRAFFQAFLQNLPVGSRSREWGAGGSGRS
jgi:F-type H+-transporting ATPase subunit b